MRFDSEAEFEGLIVEHHKNSGVCPILDETTQKMYRQINIPGYGVVDIVSVDVYADPGGVSCSIVLYELKVVPLADSHISQISRYYQGFIDYLERFYGFVWKGHGIGKLYCDDIEISVNISAAIVTQKDPNISDACYAIESSDWLRWFVFKLDIAKGVVFEEQDGWYATSRTQKKLCEDRFNFDCLLEQGIETYVEARKVSLCNSKKG